MTLDILLGHTLMAAVGNSNDLSIVYREVGLNFPSKSVSSIK